MANQKQKTHKSTAKRFRVTRTGKVLHMKGRRSHLQRRKSARAKRLFQELLPTAPGDAKRVRRLLPYGRN